MTVERALEVAPLRDGVPEVLAAEDGLQRTVRWVHSAEVRNIASLLRGGELLLTTGMAILTESDATALVGELAARGVAALVIELGPALPTIPAPMVAAAEREGLPLVCLHREVAFVEVTEAIHSEIVAQQLSMLRRTEATHRRFTALLMDGGSPQTVLDALAEIVANPVLLEDGHGRLVYHAGYRSDDGDVLSAWDQMRVAPRGVPSLEVPLPGARAAGGRLLVLGLDSDLDHFGSLAAERAAELLALASVRADHEQALALMERGQFLERLAGGRLRPREAAAQARTLWFECAGRRVLPIALALKPAAVEERSAAPMWSEIARELDRAGLRVLAGTRPTSSAMLLLAAIDSKQRRPALAQRVADTAQRAARRSFGGSHVLAVGVGADAEWPVAGRELAGAFKTATAAPPVASGGWLDACRPDLDRLLWALAERDEVRRFVLRRIGPLLDGSPRSRKLLATLTAYCATGGRVSDAAARLHLRRQALYYRLATIEGTLSVDLDDEQTRLGIHLAIRLLRFADR